MYTHASFRRLSRWRSQIVAALVALLCVSAAPAVAEGASYVWVDTPRNGAVVGTSFHVGGWALDWAATTTTGVGVVHVWAYPSSGASPIFLGVPARWPRPDVAAAFGANFLNSGFALNVAGLAPGGYTLAIYPWSEIRAAFDYGSARAIKITVQQPLTGSTPGATALKVLHWNIHHGVGTDGVYDLSRYVRWINQWRPDIISINEAEKNTSWGNEDQPARFKAMLEQATGYTWYYHFAQEYGYWSANGKGNLILSRFPFVSTAREVLSWSRSMAIATVTVNGRNVAFMSTHLDPYDRAKRYTQAKEVVALASTWASPAIIGGDFNAWPDQTSIGVMTASYTDSWALAELSGTASAPADISPFGATRNGRIDYIFHRASTSVLILKRVQVPDTRDASGVMPSDHRPVLATYEVR